MSKDNSVGTQSRPGGIGRRGMVLAALSGTALIGLGASRITGATTHSTAVPVLATPRHTAWPSLNTTEWGLFRDRFIQDGQRVVDDGNHGVSHSEGQGIGMLAAAMFGAESEFRGLWGWTREVLQTRGDALHAWHFDPAVTPGVTDSNSATDGDILIAYALFNAAARWGNAAYRHAASEIVADLERAVVVEKDGRAILLPGATGFAHPEGFVVNPSYYVFPALDRFVAEQCGPVWQRVRADGLELLRQAQFGAWDLPPDWMRISRQQSGLDLPGAWPARFSYDAVRLPLYLAWSGRIREPAVTAAAAFWQQARGGPAWVDLRTGVCASYKMPSGMAAIRDFVQLQCGGTAARPRSVAQATNYYDAALTLLVHVARVSESPSGEV